MRREGKVGGKKEMPDDNNYIIIHGNYYATDLDGNYRMVSHDNIYSHRV